MSKAKTKKTDQQMANILYQRLGTNVYAFAELDGEVYVSKVDSEKEAESSDFFFDAVTQDTDKDPSPKAD